MYTDKVLDHFKNPRNQGKLDNPDAFAQKGNPVCGDVMKMYLKVGKLENNEEYLENIKFETLGCAAAIAVSSALTDLAKGKSLDQAKKITRDIVAEYLGGLPATKMHCSMLGVDALQQAIKNYENKENDPK